MPCSLVVYYVGTNVSAERTAFVVRRKWRWRKCIPSKRGTNQLDRSSEDGGS